MNSWLCLVVGFAVLHPSRTPAQSNRLEFEVASLKPNASGAPGYSILPIPGGRLQARNINLKRLVAVAYSVTDFQIFSKVGWFESERYDMDAKAAGPAALPQLRLMLRSLLDDRFHLKIHRETREMPIFSLLPTGKGTGSGLVEMPGGDCTSASTDQAPLANGTPCGVVNLGRGRINGMRGRMSQLADRLSTLLERTVVDKTGLTGNYNMTATWPMESDQERDGVFAALEQQLGLKLVSGKGPVEVIVVDSAERAAAN